MATTAIKSPYKKRINPMDTHVGKQIRIARLALGMSQEKLADALNLTFQQVQKYEKGTNRVSGSRLQEIANALKVAGVETFFQGGPGYNNGGGKKVDPVTFDVLSTTDGLKMCKLWQELPSSQRRAILHVAESMVDPS